MDYLPKLFGDNSPIYPLYKKIKTTGRFAKNLFLKVFNSKKKRYLLAITIDVACMVLIIVNGIQPAKRIITPIVNSLNELHQKAIVRETKEAFSFAPSGSTVKMRKVDTEGLDILAFFDLPLGANGEINKDHRGYISFKGGEAAQLFERAKFTNTRVVATLTLSSPVGIRKLLDDEDAKNNLIDDAIQETKDSDISGVLLDFEYHGSLGGDYKAKFSELVRALNARMEAELPGSLVLVAIEGEVLKDDKLLDLKRLAEDSDRLLVIASDFIVPEVKNNSMINPVYGYKGDEYWGKVAERLGKLSGFVPTGKLVMERAFYGNGDNYPLYKPKSTATKETGVKPSHVLLDPDTIERLVSGVPAKAREAARRNIPLIGKALKDEGILNSNVLAYALATVEHETAGTFEPLEEYSGRFSARRLGYEGGMNYFGRGFIQLTHLRNYKKVGERIGMGDALVKNPELAGSPEVAAKILAAFFADNNIANLASKGHFIAARMPVNPDNNGRLVARLASKYYN